MDKENIIVSQNSNSATATVMAALVNANIFSYEDVRANWADLHQIVFSNTLATAGAQSVVAAFPDTQVTPAPVAPAAAPQAAPAARSTGKGQWVRAENAPIVANAIIAESMNGVVFGSQDSDFYCNQKVKQEGNLNGKPINSKTYPHAKVKPATWLKNQDLVSVAEHAIDFDKLPDSFVRPPAYVRN